MHTLLLYEDTCPYCNKAHTFADDEYTELDGVLINDEYINYYICKACLMKKRPGSRKHYYTSEQAKEDAIAFFKALPKEKLRRDIL